jgi:hypothetical protein
MVLTLALVGCTGDRIKQGILLAILACVLVATALAGWLSMRAIDYFLAGG